MNDLELVERVRSGDRDSYAELVRGHHAKVFGLCCSILGDRFAAEDAAQEIFIKAYRSLNQFHKDSAFSTWLYRVASNHCLDVLRKKSREKTDSLDAILESGAAYSAKNLPLSSDAARAAENSDLVARALSRLPPDYRLILALREAQGLSYNELAQTLSCSLDAVKARLKRARQSLDEILRHFLEPGNV